MIIPLIARSGTIASGNVGWPHLASGAVRSGHIGNSAVLSGSVGSGQIASGHLASGLLANLFSGGGGMGLGSGTVISGYVASGAIQGFFGATRHIASGTVGVSDFGSGAVIAGTVGSGAIISGNIASGQVGQFHVASGTVTSGRLGVVGAPDGTKFLRDDFNWAVAGTGLGSGNVMSGFVASGAIQGFFGATRHIASGTIGVTDFGSGAVVTGTVGSGAIISGNIASGQIGSFHLADNSVTSGDIASGQVGKPHVASGAVGSGQLATTGTPTGSLFLRDDFTWAGASMASGVVSSGFAASGSIQGFFGSTRHIASGTVGVFDFGSGAVIAGTIGSGAVTTANIGSGAVTTNKMAIDAILSGQIGSGAVTGRAGGGSFVIASGTVTTNDLGSGAIVSGLIASGVVGQFHVSSGAVSSGRLATTGTPDGTKFLRDDFSWQAGTALTSGVVASGFAASGLIQGFFGATRHIASGTVGVSDFGSGAVVVGAIGSGAVISGNIGSGQVGNLHVASGSISSGRLSTTGTPDGTKFLRDDFSWATAGGGLSSGNVGSGFISSGTVQGFFGTTRHIASGTVGVTDFGSGAVVVGTIGSGAVVSGNVASGQLANNHFASGATITRSVFGAPFVSGTAWSLITEEPVSGVRAVHLGPSGAIRVAMASVSGRMPAFGIVVDNVLSGIPANVYTFGNFQLTSGLADYSGFLGRQLFVGRSGHLTTVSGSFNSGGLLSGDVWQPVGVALNSGALAGSIPNMLPFVVSLVYSGDIASGNVGWPHMASGAVQSGIVASGAVIGSVPGGGTTHMISSGSIMYNNLGSGSVQSGHVASGQIGSFAVSSGAVGSGRLSTTGTPDGSKFLRDDFSWQTPAGGGGSLTSGAVQSGNLGSGSVGGFFGITRHIQSGTVGATDFGSGAILSGHIGSGAIIGSVYGATPRMIASGTLTTLDFASGSIVTFARGLVPFYSGTPVLHQTEEAISGVRAVHLTESGTIRIAMASVSGRMPAAGVVLDNVPSGFKANIYSHGVFELTSGLINASGYAGRPIYVGRSGQLSTVSGWFNSGGFLSGDVWQPIGFSALSGCVQLAVAAQLPFVVGQVVSGDIASGAVCEYHIASGTAVGAAYGVSPFVSGMNWTAITSERISGIRAVTFDQSGAIRIAMASVSGRMPAMGIVYDNVESGIQCNVYIAGIFISRSGMCDYSGYFGRKVYVGRSGQITTISGSWSSGGFASGDIGQTVGMNLLTASGACSGAVVFNVTAGLTNSGGPLGGMTNEGGIA